MGPKVSCERGVHQESEGKCVSKETRKTKTGREKKLVCGEKNKKNDNLVAASVSE